MERAGATFQYPPLRWRCAAILEFNPETKKDEYRIINNPSIGDVRSLRNRGAIIMYLLIERHGRQVDRTWVTEAGRPIVVRTDFLPCKEEP